MSNNQQRTAGDDLQSGLSFGSKAIKAMSNAGKAGKTAGAMGAKGAAVKSGAGAASGAKGGAAGAAVLGVAGFLLLLLIIVIVLVVAVLLVMLPNVITGAMFGRDSEGSDLRQQYDAYVEIVEHAIEDAKALTWDKINTILDEYEEKGYDRALMEQNITQQLDDQVQYNAAYILALYSAHTGDDPSKWSKEEFTAAVNELKPYMYKLVEPMAEESFLVPVQYEIYEPVVVNQVFVTTGSSVNGKLDLFFEVVETTEYYDYMGIGYVDNEAGQTITVCAPADPILVPLQNEAGEDILVFETMNDVRPRVYYLPTGTQTLFPEKIMYIKIEVEPFDEAIWESTFEIEFDAIHEDSGMTYRQFVAMQAATLNRLLLGIDE